MKKWLTIVVVVLVLLIASACIFLPKEVDSSNIERISCSINSINRFLINENKWLKWWPGTITHDSVTNKNVFDYNGYQYLVTAIKYNAIEIETRSMNLL